MSVCPDQGYQGVLLECSGNEVLFELQARKGDLLDSLVGWGVAIVSP